MCAAQTLKLLVTTLDEVQAVLVSPFGDPAVQSVPTDEQESKERRQTGWANGPRRKTFLLQPTAERHVPFQHISRKFVMLRAPASCMP